MEEGEEDGVSGRACSGGVVESVELGRESSVVEGEAGVEDLGCGLPECWVAAEKAGGVELGSEWHDCGGY